MVSRFKKFSPGQAAVWVTHDRHIFSIKQFTPGLSHEDVLDAGYPDAVASFEKDVRVFAVARQFDPVRILWL